MGGVDWWFPSDGALVQASWRNSHIQVAGSITSITAHLDCLRLLCEDGPGNRKWHAQPRPESHLRCPFHRCLFLRISRSLFPRSAIGGITGHPLPLFAPFLPSMSISLDMCAPGHPACVCGCGCVSFSMVLSGTRDALSPRLFVASPREIPSPQRRCEIRTILCGRCEIRGLGLGGWCTRRPPTDVEDQPLRRSKARSIGSKARPTKPSERRNGSPCEPRGEPPNRARGSHGARCVQRKARSRPRRWLSARKGSERRKKPKRGMRSPCIASKVHGSKGSDEGSREVPPSKI